MFNGQSRSSWWTTKNPQVPNDHLFKDNQKVRLKTKKPKRHPQTYLTPKTGEKTIRKRFPPTLLTLLRYNSPKTRLRPVGSWMSHQSAGTWTWADQSGIGHSGHLFTFPDRNTQKDEHTLQQYKNDDDRRNTSDLQHRPAGTFSDAAVAPGLMQSWAAFLWVMWNQFWYNHTHTQADTRAHTLG